MASPRSGLPLDNQGCRAGPAAWDPVSMHLGKPLGSGPGRAHLGGDSATHPDTTVQGMTSPGDPCFF